MARIFHEDFQVRCGDCPGGWLIERNSELPISAVEVGEGCFDLLSSGNKYVPITPVLTNAEMQLDFSCNYDLAGRFEVFVSFRYELQTRTGEAIRLCNEGGSQSITVSYGTMSDNVFHPQSQATATAEEESFRHPMTAHLRLAGRKLGVTFLGHTWQFATAEPHPGRFALSRGHFFDTLKILGVEVRATELPVPVSTRRFTVGLPEEPTFAPIEAQVELMDYGDCCEARLTLSGGVPETQPGEGNYHGMRADLLNRPYFSVLTAERAEKNLLYDGEIVLVVEELAPPSFYGVLHRKVDWPFRRMIRYLKPSGEYNLAVGFETYLHTTAKTLAQSPSETIFTPEGKVLYSGLGFRDLPQTVSFKSQDHKELQTRLPTEDPRYGQACEYLRDNHYFLEGEPILFQVRVSSARGELPVAFEVVLENAFLEPLRTLDFQVCLREERVGVLSVSVAECTCEPLSALAPGVYHLRFRSRDRSVSALEDYCAFEVMSRQPEALPPPLLSGLPFLYCGRTETRGLETDAFDPWHGHSVDEAHYMACANFLPPCAREHRIAPTVHAYQRTWFLWLSSRCSDHPNFKDNMDLIAQADYINVTDGRGIFSLLWRYQYTGQIFQDVIEFLKATGDRRFDLEKMARECNEGKALSLEDFRLLAEHHWPQWLDTANRLCYQRRCRLLTELRQVNPALLLANYGPAHIYASHYKGGEFVRYLLNGCLTPAEQGFWQYEDYPSACRYGIERGTYFLAASLLACPGHRIYPEIYTYSIQGCPDGAVFYAYPPYGRRRSNPPLRIRRRVFDYAFATGHYVSGQGFVYWEHPGFQACGFDRERYETLLRAWRVVRDYPPRRPLRCAAYVTSEAAWQANQSVTVVTPMGGGSIVDVRKTAMESVPFAYEMMRRGGANAGFQVRMENLEEMSCDQCDLLVLPPLTGAGSEELTAIRRLHAQGVNLICFEDVTGLEDLFGVSDTGTRTPVRQLRGTTGFLPGKTEFCDEPLCAGRYAPADAEVLLEGTIPVLMSKRNGQATAAFFNVPPTLVRDDQLHGRMGYGKDSISELVNQAMMELGRRLSQPDVTISAGRLIAFEAKTGEVVLVVTNPDEHQAIHPVVELGLPALQARSMEADCPWAALPAPEGMIRLRLNLQAEESGVVVFR